MQYSQKLDQIEARFEDITRQMADPVLISDSETYRKTAKSRSELEEVVTKYREYKHVRHNFDEAKQMLEDPDAELRQMAVDAVHRLDPEFQPIEKDPKVLLLPN